MMPAMNPKLIARAIAAGRIGFGLGLLISPEQLTTRWIGRDSTRPGTRVVTRGLGGRDLALGLGALASREADLPRWLLAGMAGDASDLGATLAAGGEVPLTGRILVGALAAGALVLGARTVAALPRG